MIAFRVRRALSRRRWRKYWIEQDNKAHIEFYRKMAADWRTRDRWEVYGDG